MNYIFFTLTFFMGCATLSLEGHDLVNLKSHLPQVACRSDQIFVHRHVATRLKRVQKELAELGIGIIVYDGYRTPTLESFPDDSMYRKGMGIDVAIYYLNGCHLAMPTEYGDDSPHARRDCIEWPAHIYHNCRLLENCMVKYGFESVVDNWWHFNLKGWDYQMDLNLEFSDLCSPNYHNMIYQKFRQ